MHRILYKIYTKNVCVYIYICIVSFVVAYVAILTQPDDSLPAIELSAPSIENTIIAHAWMIGDGSSALSPCG